MRRMTLAIVILAAGTMAPMHAQASAITVDPISFTVTNPLEPTTEYTVNGHIYLPASPCTDTVILLSHGLSYGEWGWDFGTVNDVEYSVARELARAGYPAVAIDRLGYGSSPHPDGHLLTVQGYAAMTDQIVAALRADGYQKVGLMGHSAGTELSEFAQGMFGSGDLLIATAYHHFPSQRIVTDFVTGDSVRAVFDDYEYFGGTEEQRSEYMFNLDIADPDVVALDNARANPTPSGEVHTIGVQPSRYVAALIDVPVLMVIAEQDLLFPRVNSGVDITDAERALFASASDYTTQIVPDAGHSYFLHPGASVANAGVIAWLGARAAAC